jgi:signal transduction histidine kinase
MIGYAIFKHQLMDITIVIRKTLIYSLASATLAAVYVGLVTVLVHLLQGIVGQITIISSTLVACLMGALFHPVSSRVQAFVDAYFFRKRVDRESRLMEFSNEVARGEDLQKMTVSLCQIVAETLHPTSLALYLLAEDGSEFLQVSPDAQIALPKRMPRSNVWSQYFAIHANPLIHGLKKPLLSSEDEVVLLDEAITQLMETRQAAAFPLLHHESLLGYLLLGDKASGELYSEEDIVLMQIIMNQAALAYERPKLLNEITGAFVHEVKMPLANISLPAELTYMDLEDVENGRKSFTEILSKMKKRMKYIMEQASLAGGRMEAIREISGSQNVVQTEVNLAQVIQDSVGAVEHLLQRAQIRLQVDLPDVPVSVIGNAKQLEIVIVNLLKNGIEAMQASAVRNGGTDLRIRLQAQTEDVVFEIEDSGPGIKNGDLPQLFKSHFTTKGARGVGMGLYISRQIIKGHGGTLDLRTREGQGTTFVIRLKKYHQPLAV